MTVAWTGREALALTALTLATYGTTCHLCRRPGATTADHVIPRRHGGTNTLENLRPAHKLCNERRGARTILWFRRRYAPWLVATRRIESLDFFSPEAGGNPRAALPLPPGQNKTSPETDPETMPRGA